MSQTWVAELADMSTSQLSRLEAGERTMTLQQGLTLCRVLQISIAELTGNPHDPTQPLGS